MKRNEILLVVSLGLVLVFFLCLLHIVEERKSTLVIVVNGSPATAGLRQLGGQSKLILPDKDGRYLRPADTPPDMGFTFKTSPNANWLLKFPHAGTKVVEINGLDVVTTHKLVYFGIFESSTITDQRTLLSPESEVEPNVN